MDLIEKARHDFVKKYEGYLNEKTSNGDLIEFVSFQISPGRPDSDKFLHEFMRDAAKAGFMVYATMQMTNYHTMVFMK